MASRPPNTNTATSNIPISSPNPPRPPTRPQQTTDPLYPPQLGTGNALPDDAPPSYEDAMADEISPADGPRREYSGVTDVTAPGLDEKGGLGGRMAGIGGSGGEGGGKVV